MPEQVSICQRLRIGLNSLKPMVSSQYFASNTVHSITFVVLTSIVGTGTPAGDPQEAEAISQAFFAGQKCSREEARGEGTPPLFVGSIKTVIGHTESTAGIAGILKASLALQHGVIPPNFLLDNFKLSPQVEPFYQHLYIPKEAQPWPKVAYGQPRRVSVNSFGMIPSAPKTCRFHSSL